MAASPVSPDLKTVRSTLIFLGRELRTQQFVLRGQIRQRNAALNHEKMTRTKIKGLKRRIESEMDRHPDLFRRLNEE